MNCSAYCVLVSSVKMTALIEESDWIEIVWKRLLGIWYIEISQTSFITWSNQLFGSVGGCLWSRIRSLDKAVVLSCFCWMPLSRLRRIESIITHERQNHTVIDSLRQFDRALLPCCSWYISACIRVGFLSHTGRAIHSSSGWAVTSKSRGSTFGLSGQIKRCALLMISNESETRV